MKLFYSGASPYVRKVMVCAHELGLAGRIEFAPTAVVPIKPNADYARTNPLMKVPALVTDDGMTLFDSRVICEYLDALGGNKLIPVPGPARWRALTRAAACEGALDAAILCRYEGTIRAEGQRHADWLAGQQTKIYQVLDAAEGDPGALTGPVDIAQIGLGCAVGYLIFRDIVPTPFAGRPKLKSWYETFVARPSMQATMPKA
ncbi:MAG: glutathione S-transferase [Alphaproteobacteria bacterium]|nr:glutathione S-transferase [Alphaproteobacteria bacterium]